MPPGVTGPRGCRFARMPAGPCPDASHPAYTAAESPGIPRKRGRFLRRRTAIHEKTAFVKLLFADV